MCVPVDYRCWVAVVSAKTNYVCPLLFIKSHSYDKNSFKTRLKAVQSRQLHVYRQREGDRATDKERMNLRTFWLFIWLFGIILVYRISHVRLFSSSPNSRIVLLFIDQLMIMATPSRSMVFFYLSLSRSCQTTMTTTTATMKKTMTKAYTPITILAWVSAPHFICSLKWFNLMIMIRALF